MLVSIYARTMLNATLHRDLPQRPLADSYRPAPSGPGPIRRLVDTLGAAQKRASELRAASKVLSRQSQQKTSTPCAGG